MTLLSPYYDPEPDDVGEALCPRCNGYGYSHAYWTCSNCNGRGIVEIEMEDWEECWDEPEGGD